MNRFPVLKRFIVSGYRLYPDIMGKPGIDFTFESGVSLLAGINGLGKTTLITMLYRLIVGPFELPKDDASSKFGSTAKASVVSWSSRTRFFTQRVADRAQDAWAELHFLIGDQKFVVRRSLATMRLVTCFCEGEALSTAIDETEYHYALCNAADAGQFVDFLTVVKYLTFFNEERRDILWDEQAQRQFFRILFTRPEEAREWIEAEQQIGSADSRARNISASVYQLEEDLKKGESLLINNSGIDARLDAEQAVLDADLNRLRELESQAEALESELRTYRRDLERSKLSEDATRRSVEEIRFNRLGQLFPNLNETAQYILTNLFSEGMCLACEQHSEKAKTAFHQAIEAKLCVVCGSDLGLAPKTRKKAETISEAAFQAARKQLAHAALQRSALSTAEQERTAEWQAVLKEMGDVTAAVNARRNDVIALRSQLPPDPEELATLRASIKELRERESTEKKKRLSAEVIYERLLKRVTEQIEIAAGNVGSIFQGLIKRFLEEQCVLEFRTISDRPSQSGRQFDYPSLRFEMTAAAFEGAQVRDTPDDVSESQREFIDLAFRMALSEAAAKDRAMSMVIETPEASLDAIFMSRAAEMLRSFAKGKRSIVVTSNLTSSVMIPALMGPFTTNQRELSKRQRRVLNLLEVAAPNASARLHKQRYKKFLETGLRGFKP